MDGAVIRRRFPVRRRAETVGAGTIDLDFRRIGDDVSMAIARREGGIETIVTK